MGRWLEANDFGDITFFGQDWGGLIGLRMVVDHSRPFYRVVVGGCRLPLNADLEQDIVDKVMAFRAGCRQRLEFPGYGPSPYRV